MPSLPNTSVCPLRKSYRSTLQLGWAISRSSLTVPSRADAFLFLTLSRISLFFFFSLSLRSTLAFLVCTSFFLANASRPIFHKSLAMYLCIGFVHPFLFRRLLPPLTPVPEPSAWIASSPPSPSLTSSPPTSSSSLLSSPTVPSSLSIAVASRVSPSAAPSADSLSVLSSASPTRSMSSRSPISSSSSIISMSSSSPPPDSSSDSSAAPDWR
mmetsp:Transcript_21683/g.51053  ORF Transcript_21683/g.51053 Transcript_21683/m.51053 type:complete len:212 (-) Transcript_21683:774-1409(-)